MRVLLIGNYTPDEQTSMQLYAEMLHSALKAKVSYIELWKPQKYIAKGKWSGYYDKFIYSKKILAKKLKEFSKKAGEEAYVIHVCDHSNSIYYPLLKKYPHSISCHDLMAIQLAKGNHPQAKTRFTGKILQSWILKNLKKYSHVICVSENTKNDLLQLADPERIGVIYSALNKDFQITTNSFQILYTKYKLPLGVKILLNLSSNSWYKNREGLIRSFALLKDKYEEDCYLIIAGAPLPEELLLLAKELGIEGHLRIVTKPSHQELTQLYQLADLFFFPSRYEGFGWPPLEAQACGTPVVAGRGGSQEEVLHKSALVADPDDIEQMAENCLQLLTNENLSTHMIELGHKNLERFQLKNMTDNYIQFFEEVYEDFA